MARRETLRVESLSNLPATRVIRALSPYAATRESPALTSPTTA